MAHLLSVKQDYFHCNPIHLGTAIHGGMLVLSHLQHRELGTFFGSFTDEIKDQDSVRDLCISIVLHFLLNKDMAALLTPSCHQAATYLTTAF